MGAARQDSWQDEDDQLLAEVTLQQIRNGGTQLLAFQEAANRLGRTPAACGFRWNSVVRKQYEASIQSAKSERKRKHGSGKMEFLNPEKDIVKDIAEADVLGAKRRGRKRRGEIEILNVPSRPEIRSEMAEQVRAWCDRYVDLEVENQNLRYACEQMQAQMDALQNQYQQMNEDYQAIVKIMERARRMTLFTEEEPVPKRRFRMDENGNLEQYLV